DRGLRPAEPAQFIEVGIHELAAEGLERQTELRRPSRCALRSAPEREGRASRLCRPREDLDGGAAELERFARPRFPQCLDRLNHERWTTLPVHAEGQELLAPVARTECDAEPSPRHKVENGEVLGEPDRMLQRSEHYR